MFLKKQARALAALILTGLAPASGVAQPAALERDLARLSLEELLNIEISSASRKEERAVGVPAAVFVITRDDIRRSGIRTLPELFRLVPGMQVAQVNASNWAVSIRGFNDVYSNKLLVLIDGRSIYNRAFSGVFWSMEDLVVDDIERIEVVRGPGGATWGANAVNGVINVVTRSAHETQGALVRLGHGSFDGTQAATRYGGNFGRAAYRVYAQWSDRGQSSPATGKATDASVKAGDEWNSLTTGFRIDRRAARTAFMAAGGFVYGESNPLWDALTAPTPDAPKVAGVLSDRRTLFVIGRGTHTFAGGSALQVQSFFTARTMNDPTNRARESVADLDVEYHAKTMRHALVVGGGIRGVDDRNTGSFAVTLPASENLVSNLFAQDEISLHRRVRASLGAKFEHDTVAGLGVQPTARLAWDVVPGQHAWVAVSRARRTPSSIDLGLRANYAVLPGENDVPVLLGVLGNPAYQTETLVSTEVGYRVNVRSTFSVDATVFRGHYDRLKTIEPLEPRLELTPGPPHVFVGGQFANGLEIDTTGLEVAAQWTPTRAWRLDGSYAGLRLSSHLEPTSRDTAAAAAHGNAPVHQWQMRSTVWLGRRAELTAAVFHVGPITSLDVPAYTRADVTGEVKVRGGWSFTVVGRNLLDPRHIEYSSASIGMAATSIPRNGSVHLVWRF